jgi:cell division protein FtsW (lipid II flippase)
MTRSLEIAIVAVIALSAAWMFLFGGMDYLVKKGIVKPYELDRVLTHNNPEEDFNGKGRRIIKSKRAIGSG